MSTLDALAVSTQRMNNASTMEENLASSPKEARFPVHMSSPVGSYTAGTLEMHKVLSGSQLAEDAISVEQDASERHKGASEALAGTIGVICPCCGVLASDPSSIFTTDVSGTRQHFCLVCSSSFRAHTGHIPCHRAHTMSFHTESFCIQCSTLSTKQHPRQ